LSARTVGAEVEVGMPMFGMLLFGVPKSFRTIVGVPAGIVAIASAILAAAAGDSGGPGGGGVRKITGGADPNVANAPAGNEGSSIRIAIFPIPPDQNRIVCVVGSPTVADCNAMSTS
jgi:hypothetical protein